MIPLRDVIPSRTRPGVTIGLIALNVLVFLFQATLPGRTSPSRSSTPSRSSRRYFSLVDVFTSMFVHAGFAHLAGNLLFLWIFGDNVEDRLGHGRFAVFYLALRLRRRLRADRAQSRLARSRWSAPAAPLPA